MKNLTIKLLYFYYYVAVAGTVKEVGEGSAIRMVGKASQLFFTNYVAKTFLGEEKSQELT